MYIYIIYNYSLHTCKHKHIVIFMCLISLMQICDMLNDSL